MDTLVKISGRKPIQGSTCVWHFFKEEKRKVEETKKDTPHLRPSYKVPSAFIPSVTASLASPRMWSTPSYVVAGETGRRLRERFSEHLRSVRNKSPGFPVAEHFNSASHSLNDIMICGLKRCSGDNTRRKKQEMRLIFELGTLKPNVLNVNFRFI